MIFREAKRYGINGYKCIEVAKPAEFEIQKAATCSHSGGRKWPQVARRSTGRIWNFQSSVAGSHLHYLQPLAATCSGCKWLQVAANDASDAAWTASTSPNGPTRENLKKKCFSRELHFFKFSLKREVRVETKGKKWQIGRKSLNERMDATKWTNWKERKS